jgi:hypothetical protein
MVRALIPLYLLAACAALPEAALSPGDAQRLCAALAAEPGLLERGSLGARLRAAPDAPCRAEAEAAAARAEAYRMAVTYDGAVRIHQ